MKPLENSYWYLYGSTLENPILPVAPRSFLFICTGNVCRSVFAQALAEKMQSEIEKLNFTFDSAGLKVTVSMPPPQEAMIAAREFGVPLDNHRSKMVSREMIDFFDMAIAMEARQLKVLKLLFPQSKDKFFLLPLFDEVGQNTWDHFSVYNIEDPFGKDLIQFRACYKRIERCLAGFFSELR